MYGALLPRPSTWHRKVPGPPVPVPCRTAHARTYAPTALPVNLTSLRPVLTLHHLSASPHHLANRNRLKACDVSAVALSTGPCAADAILTPSPPGHAASGADTGTRASSIKRVCQCLTRVQLDHVAARSRHITTSRGLTPMSPAGPPPASCTLCLAPLRWLLLSSPAHQQSRRLLPHVPPDQWCPQPYTSSAVLQ